MKSYTDIEQSKKLSEILPLESADFFWIIGHLHTDGPRYEIIRSRNEVSEPENYWPCWSLSALLDVLPYTIKDHNDRNFYFKLESVENDAGYRGYNIQYYQDIECYLMTMYDYDSPIDACYEMIVTLKEKGLL